MEGRKVATGCGLAAVAAFGLLSLVLLLFLGAGLFLVRSTVEGGPVVVGPDVPALADADYETIIEEPDGEWFRLWAFLSETCIGISTSAGDSATCGEPGTPIVQEIPLETSTWWVTLSRVGVTIEPTDRTCVVEHHDTLDDFNLSWCRVS